MRLLALGQAAGRSGGGANGSYKGTYRDRPHYADEFPDDHPVNQAFFWSIQKDPRLSEEEVELDAMRNLTKAKGLIATYKWHTGEEFDLVEVTRGNEQPEAGGEFLGFDLSRGIFNSLLWYGLEVCYQQPGAWDAEREDILRLIQPLVCLVEAYYKPRLNANGLFEDAQSCLDCMTSIQTIGPDWFESGENNFEVVGIYKISTEPE